MRIESGTTGERRTRWLLFLVMCAVFAGWFAYDGLWGYPAKNLKWAIPLLPEPPAEAWTNPRMTVNRAQQVTEDMSIDDLKGLLGEPIQIEREHHIYEGTDLRITVFVEENAVSEVTHEPISDNQAPERPNPRVREQVLERLETGMPEQELAKWLGEPTESVPTTYWYIGPAAYAAVEVDDGRATGQVLVQENNERTENDILLQRVIASALGTIVLVVLVKLVLVLRTRAVLDDNGLKLNGRTIPWDAMTGLKIDEFKDKGWVDLEFQKNGERKLQRLDSYHLARFDEIIEAICERKGFASPLDQAEDEGGAFPVETPGQADTNADSDDEA